MTKKEWEALQNVDLRLTGKSTLAQLEDILPRPDLPHAEQLRQFAEQIRNPYCFLCGDTPVKLHFSADGEPLERILLRYFTHLNR